MAALEHVLHKRKQAGEFIPRIHIFLDDIEGKVIKPAETPDAQRQQQTGRPFGIVQKDQRRRNHADEQEQNPLQFDPKWTGKIFHLSKFKIASAARRVAPGSPSKAMTLSSCAFILARRGPLCSNSKVACAKFSAVNACCKNSGYTSSPASRFAIVKVL